MENVSEFDLNASVSFWLESLAKSPHFRMENVAEMEIHVRDSIVRLQNQGLSAEESFLIAIRRVGPVERIEAEFAKVNRSFKAMIPHVLILTFVSIGCWFLWALLHFPHMMAQATRDMTMPAFTRFVVGCGSYLFVPPTLAALYCVYVWIKKSRGNNSWSGFFATTMAFLVLLTLPTLIAVLLPVIAFMQNQFVGK